MSKRQPKSGSKRNRRPQPKRRAQQARTIPLSQESVELLQGQLDAFRKKFGREPGPNDPVFFDPAADEPRPLSDEQIDTMGDDLAQMMKDNGAPPEFVHAYMLTTRIVTDHNRQYLSDEDIQEWNEAVAAYFLRDELAEQAASHGAHPAIVHAVRTTGILRPSTLEIDPNGHGVTAYSEPDKAWVRAMIDFCKAHPEVDQPKFDPNLN